MGKFIEATEAGDALAFQDHFNERMNDKVALALDACKIEVAKKFFNLKDDEPVAEEVVAEDASTEAALGPAKSKERKLLKKMQKQGKNGRRVMDASTKACLGK